MIFHEESGSRISLEIIGDQSYHGLKTTRTALMDFFHPQANALPG